MLRPAAMTDNKMCFAKVYLWETQQMKIVPIENVLKFKINNFNPKTKKKYTIKDNNSLTIGCVLDIADSKEALEETNKGRMRIPKRKYVSTATENSTDDEIPTKKKRKVVTKIKKGLHTPSEIQANLKERLTNEINNDLFSQTAFQFVQPAVPKKILEDPIAVTDEDPIMVTVENLSMVAYEDPKMTQVDRNIVEEQVLIDDIEKLLANNTAMPVAEDALTEGEEKRMESFENLVDDSSDEEEDDNDVSDSDDEDVTVQTGMTDRTFRSKLLISEKESSTQDKLNDKEVLELSDENVTFSGIVSQFKDQRVKNRDEISKLKNDLNNALKQITTLQEMVKQKDNLLKIRNKRINQLDNLNIGLQNTVMENIQQLTDAFLHEKQKISGDEETLEPPVGRLSLDRKKFHMGRNEYMLLEDYAKAMSSIRSYHHFVRNLATTVFKEETLLKSTIYGQKSNRDKEEKEFESLDITKLLAIRDTYSYWLQHEQKFSRDYADFESFKIIGVISKQIADLKKLRNDKKLAAPRGGKILGHPRSPEAA